MRIPLKTKNISVGKTDVHYFTGGKGEPLLIIHGGGEDANSWLENAGELAKHYEVFLPDLPGFGQSEAFENGFVLSEFVSFVDDFSKALELEKFHLIGHSIGGSVALNYALLHPYRVKRLALISCVGLGKRVSPLVKTLCSPAIRNSLAGLAGFIVRATRWVGFLLNRQFSFKNPASGVKIGMAGYISALGAHTNDFLSRLTDLDVPTLLVWGDRDIVVPVADAYGAAAFIPDCHLQVFRDCGHSVYQEKSREFLRLVLRFLKS